MASSDDAMTSARRTCWSSACQSGLGLFAAMNDVGRINDPRRARVEKV